MKRFICSCLLLLSIAAQAQKKPLDHSAYDQWQSVKDVILSNDGNWMSKGVPAIMKGRDLGLGL